jgi:hypothetical protein
MTIYNDSNGIQTYPAWKTEEQYQAVAAFFKKLLGKNGIMPGDPGNRISFSSKPRSRWMRSGTSQPR